MLASWVSFKLSVPWSVPQTVDSILVHVRQTCKCNLFMHGEDWNSQGLFFTEVILQHACDQTRNNWSTHAHFQFYFRFNWEHLIRLKKILRWKHNSLCSKIFNFLHPSFSIMWKDQLNYWTANTRVVFAQLTHQVIIQSLEVCLPYMLGW